MKWGTNMENNFRLMMSAIITSIALAPAASAHAQERGTINPFRPLSQPTLEHFGTPFDLPFSDHAFTDAKGWTHDFNRGSIILEHEELGATIELGESYFPSFRYDHKLYALGPDNETVHVAILYRDPKTDDLGDDFIGFFYTYNASKLHAAHGEGEVAGGALPVTLLSSESWSGEGELWRTIFDLGDIDHVTIDDQGHFRLHHRDGIDALWLGAAISLEPVLAREDIDELITESLPDENISGDWSFRDFAFTSDGGLFALARSDDDTTGYVLVLQMLPDDQLLLRQITNRTLPTASSGYLFLFYDRERDAIVRPVFSGDYLNYRFNPDCSGASTVTARWQGYGLQYFPVTSTSIGYVSLTEALIRELRCGRGANFGKCDAAEIEFLEHDHRIMVRLEQTDQEDERYGDQLYHVILNDHGVDFDQDGLTNAEEASLGSDDFDRDSDGGGVTDAVEWRRGTDPTDSSDDGAPRLGEDRDAVRYAASQVLFIKKPWMVEPRTTSGDVANLKITRGPYCVRLSGLNQDASCFAPDGSEVAKTTEDALWSLDGTAQVFVEEDGVVRESFADGRREVVVTRAETDRLDLTLNTRWIPIDRDLIFAVKGTQERQVVVAFSRGEEPLEVDLMELRCELGLGVCESQQPMPHNLRACGGIPGSNATYGKDIPFHDFRESDVDGRYRDFLYVLGADPDTREVLVLVVENYGQVVLAISPRGEVRRLLNQEDLLPFDRSSRAVLDRRALDGADPSRVPIDPRPLAHMIETGHGDMLQVNERIITGEGDAGLIQSAALTTPNSMTAPHGSFSLGVPSFLKRIWDDTIIGDQTSQPGDAFEHVRYDSYGFDPGDVIVADRFVDNGVHGFYLDRSGPRGGFAPLTFEGIGIEIHGIDVSTDGRVCIAGQAPGDQPETFVGVALVIDPTDEELFAEDGSFEDASGLIFDGRVYDCTFAPETDDLIVLTGSARGVELWRATAEDLEATTATVEETWATDDQTAPNAIAWTPREHPRVETYLRDDQGYATIAYDHEGRQLGLIEESTYDDFYKIQTYRYIRIERDGEELTRIDLKEDFIHFSPPTERQRELLPRAGQSDMVVRPDGLIVVSAGNHVFVINPDTGLYGFLGTYGSEYWMLPSPVLAVYPGGGDEDPWKMSAPGTRFGDPSTDDDSTGSPDERDEEGSKDGRRGCACSSSPTRPIHPMWMLLGCLVIAARRRSSLTSSNGRRG